MWTTLEVSNKFPIRQTCDFFFGLDNLDRFIVLCITFLHNLLDLLKFPSLKQFACALH